MNSETCKNMWVGVGRLTKPNPTQPTNISTQPNPTHQNSKISQPNPTQTDPTQPNPRVNPTRGQLWSTDYPLT